MRGKVSAVTALLLLAVSLCALALSGCAGAGKNQAAGGVNEEVEATLKDLHAFTGEIIKKVESAADPAAGVDDAQQYLDARRSDIGAKIDALKKIDDARLSETTRGRKMESLTEDLVSVNGLQIKFMSNAMEDAAFKSKLDKLLGDYRALVDL